jgi:hypothetical protein
MGALPYLNDKIPFLTTGHNITAGNLNKAGIHHRSGKIPGAGNPFNSHLE